jgi:hypothetical protein
MPIVIFLIGIAAGGRRHHSQVRMHPWTRFFNGDCASNKLTAATLQTAKDSTGCFYHAQAGNGPGQFFRMSRSAFSLATSRLSCAISSCSGFI